MENVDKTLLTFVGVTAALAIGVVAVLVGVYQLIESSEAELRAEMQRIEAERKSSEAELRAEMQRIEASLRAEMAALSAKLDKFIERVDSRLDEIEREQARLSAVNELLAQQIQQR